MIGISRWITTTTLREELADVMDYVLHHDRAVGVSRYWQSAAVILSPSEYIRITRLAEEGRGARLVQRELEDKLLQCRCGARPDGDEADWETRRDGHPGRRARLEVVPRE